MCAKLKGKGKLIPTGLVCLVKIKESPTKQLRHIIVPSHHKPTEIHILVVFQLCLVALVEQLGIVRLSLVGFGECVVISAHTFIVANPMPNSWGYIKTMLGLKFKQNHQVLDYLVIMSNPVYPGWSSPYRFSPSRARARSATPPSHYFVQFVF